MGVLNVTPDSFSDGGCFADAGRRRSRTAWQMHAAGADYVDVGGESTRPGADRVDAEEECRRVLPVIRELAAAGVRDQRRHHARRGRRGGARRRRRPGQRRQRRAGRHGHGRAGRRGRRPVGAHALARPQPGDVRGRPLRRRRHRGLRRADRPGRGRRRRGRRPRAAGARPGAGLRQERRAQLGAAGRPRPAGRPRACRCCVGASRKTFLGRLLADADGAAARRPSSATPRRWPPPCSPRRPGSGASGCTTPPPPSTPSAPSRPSGPPEERAAVADPAVPDRIAVRGLRAYAHHGVYAFEREQGQTFRVRRRPGGGHRARGRDRRPRSGR